VRLWAHQPREPLSAVLSEPALDTPSGKVLKTQSTIGAGSESDRIATAPR
jgi:hypothetical protein